MTSQSSQIVRSPRAERSTTERIARPIKRWISWVRPPTFPFVASLGVRSCVDRGIIPYSAVTHPWPVPRSHAGTFSSMVAVQITRVSPTEMSTEPSACLTNPRSMRMGRISSTLRPSGRNMLNPPIACPSYIHSGDLGNLFFGQHVDELAEALAPLLKVLEHIVARARGRRQHPVSRARRPMSFTHRLVQAFAQHDAGPIPLAAGLEDRLLDFARGLSDQKDRFSLLYHDLGKFVEGELLV